MYPDNPLNKEREIQFFPALGANHIIRVTLFQSKSPGIQVFNLA